MLIGIFSCLVLPLSQQTDYLRIINESFVSKINNHFKLPLTHFLATCDVLHFKVELKYSKVLEAKFPNCSKPF